MEDVIVLFETAKLAEEKGFNDGLPFEALTQSVLQKWIADVHSITTKVEQEDENFYLGFYWNGVVWYQFCEGSTYEKALELVLQTALKSIK